MNYNKEARDIVSRRKSLAVRLASLQVQQVEALEGSATNEAAKADLRWVLERRKRRVRQHARQLSVAAEALDSSSVPVAAGTMIGFKLFIDAIGAAADSPVYILGGVMAATLWAVLKLNAVRLKSRAEGLRSGIGE